MTKRYIISVYDANNTDEKYYYACDDVEGDHFVIHSSDAYRFKNKTDFTLNDLKFVTNPVIVADYSSCKEKTVNFDLKSFQWEEV